MLLTITSTHQPATDLGYLLGKHPGRMQELELNSGIARMFYTETTLERCTAVLLLEVDHVGLVRKEGNDTFALDQYVNDRPFVASSLVANAIAKCYGGAMNGHCKDRPELAQTAIPLETKIAIVSARGGEDMLCRLFAPLGYSIELEHHPLDEQFPEWGESRYFTLTLRNTITISALLTHLYVLLPVLDNEKHYYISQEESQKLLEKGKDWLPSHPDRELITRRFLKNKAHLTRYTLDMLMQNDPVSDDPLGKEPEIVAADKPRLHDQRLLTVRDALLEAGAASVLDLGCGEGKLIKLLLEKKQFSRILGMDVERRALEIAMRKLKLDALPVHQQERAKLIYGSLLYRDRRLEGFDAAAIVEVIEHLDPPRLTAFERVVFEFARPKTVVITTPNAEYNAIYGMEPGTMRHKDHRFEWTRREFEQWASGVADKFGYKVTFTPVGESDEQRGAPSQMGVFSS